MKSLFKIIEIYILRSIMRILSLFPIKENRIVFNSYTGTQYSCNPKYISEYIANNYKGQYEIVWAFREPEKYRYLEKKFGYILVKYSSPKRFFYEATAKASINNIGSFSWFPVRKGQEHINTWHGGFNIKKVGLQELANDSLMKKSIKMSSDNTTVLLSTSKVYDEIIAKQDLGYEKETLKIGFPRNDIIFKQRDGEIDLRKKVCDALNINIDSFILLYAPTYRYNPNEVFQNPDYKTIKRLLSEKIDKQIVIVTRMHHLMKNDLGNHITVDATNYSDMQELLAVSDCLITDYSSSIWDFSIIEKPILLFAPDYSEYALERGLHADLNTIGFPFAQNVHELNELISDMDFNTIYLQSRKFREDNGAYEFGDACKKLFDYIFSSQ
ncbi:MAG: CDP-glycerol glycerophosphotransferase family protein [Lachnospiraceae bacterium]|nr:CDP-glycerol glycerophosphotransferase family protein [Lachnospiraceae bacterium]